MNFFLSLVTLCNSGFLLMAQSGGQTGAASAPAGQVPAQTTPAQTSPVQSGAIQGAPSVTRPAVGGVFSGGDARQSTFSTRDDLGQSGLQSGQSATQRDLNGTSQDAGAGVQPQGGIGGVEPMDPITTPPVNALPPPIRNSLRPIEPRSGFSDPSGAFRPDSAGQGALDAGQAGGAAFPDGQNFPGNLDAGVAQQFQGLTSQNGSTAVPFPEENAVITVISRDGTLTLTGTVDSEEQRQRIGNSIRQLSSSGFIDNQLRVVPTGEDRTEAGNR